MVTVGLIKIDHAYQQSLFNNDVSTITVYSVRSRHINGSAGLNNSFNNKFAVSTMTNRFYNHVNAKVTYKLLC